MARRLVSVMVPTEGGPRAGGSGTEVRFYDDEALTTLSTPYQRATGAGTQPNGAGAGACLRPNAGANSALLADRLAADAFVTVVDVTDFQVGDLVPVQDAVNTVYRVITIITPATKRLDLDSALGFAFLAAGTRVGNEDMKGHIWAYLDDVRDYHVQVKDIASGRLLPPVSIPTRVPVTTLEVQDEGVATSTRSKINFIGASVTVTDNAGAVRADVTITPVLTTVEAFLGADVAMTNANQWYDGPSVSLVAGTWFVTANVAIELSTDNSAQARLWDGATDYATGAENAGATGYTQSVPLGAIITLGATTTIKVSCASDQAGCTIDAALGNPAAGGNKLSSIRAVKVG